MNVNNIHMQVLQRDRPMVDVDGRRVITYWVMVMGEMLWTPK